MHIFSHSFHRFIQKQVVSYEDEDLDSSYFRRKPTSFLSNSNDPKRYTWLPADEDAVRLEGPRPICQTDSNGPYVVGSYPPKSSFLSQSSEQITGLVTDLVPQFFPSNRVFIAVLLKTLITANLKVFNFHKNQLTFFCILCSQMKQIELFFHVCLLIKQEKGFLHTYMLSQHK